ncbi:MAG: hypothetical protein H7336_04545 [Bacteriovorax sp.]|nr:hypothetical protein [Bacteriovorax sp.]
MKSLLVIAMALVSVSSFAADHKMDSKMDSHKTAMEACKEHSKDKKAMDACVTEHMKAAPATEAAAPTAPAKK